MDLRVQGQPSRKGTDLGEGTGLKLRDGPTSWGTVLEQRDRPQVRDGPSSWGMDLRVEGWTYGFRDIPREKGQTSAKSTREIPTVIGGRLLRISRPSTVLRTWICGLNVSASHSFHVRFNGNSQHPSLCSFWPPLLGDPHAIFGLTQNRFVVSLQLHGTFEWMLCLRVCSLP